MQSRLHEEMESGRLNQRHAEAAAESEESMMLRLLAAKGEGALAHCRAQVSGGSCDTQHVY